MLYVGEHLWIGQLGHFFTLLAFVASLVATLAYFKATQTALKPEGTGWKRLARTAFIIEAVSVLAIFVTLYFIIYNHYFEYKYAYQHSKRSLEVKYLLSCFWEGQEGSFMLWSFWHAVLGLIIMRTAGKWEAPVMSVVNIAQLFLTSVLIGIYFFDVRIGSSPFVLMRNEFPNEAMFRDPQYLSKYLTDGNGLNVLLQNYWMVIHPPVVFLGYASTLVPFAFAIAGLWTRQYGEWTKPVLPWALFSGGILGLGIMMGAAWAYESLTFGGYWAWDPVENASLVPWLVLVGGIHTILIFRHTGHSLKASYWFVFLAFLLVLYSTFLTRTGVLGDTSVHSFTGEGSSLFWHLVLMMGSFSALFLVNYIRHARRLPFIVKEESMNSREFWMFVGSLVFFLSSGYIIAYTSLPIINEIIHSLPFLNKLIQKKWAIGEEPEYVYNRVMILVAFVIGLLTAFTQYLKYKQTPGYGWVRKIALPLGIALVISALTSTFGGIRYDTFGIGFLIAIHLALFASIYTVCANAGYIWLVMKGKLKAAGGSIAHIGFGLMLVGILISSSKKETISINRTGVFIPGLKDPKGRDDSGFENVTLIQGIPTPLSSYVVTYVGDSSVAGDEKKYFKVHYLRKDSSTGKVREEFYLYPNAFLMKGEGGRTNLSANPDSRHYWDRDIFTYITSMPDPERAQDTATFRNTPVKEGDTVFYADGFVRVDRLVSVNRNENSALPMVDSAWLAEVTVQSKTGVSYTAQPAFFVKDNQPIYKTDTVAAQGLVLQVRPSPAGLELGIKESDAIMKYITLKAFQFPMINILWLGTILMVIGFMMSAYARRVRKLKAVPAKREAAAPPIIH